MKPKREFIVAQPTKRIRHKWERVGNSKTVQVCNKCGCVKTWDFHYGRFVYSTKKGETFILPHCVISKQFVNYPSANDIGVGGYDGGDFYKY